MQLPLVEPAPVVIDHRMVFRDLFENRQQFRHVQNDLTGLLVLDNTTMANMSRCLLGRADKTKVSRFFSEGEWNHEQVHTRRIADMRDQTELHRKPAAQSGVMLDDTVCEHVGSLFEHIDRHDNHRTETYPLAHHLVTRHDISGAVRFPVDNRRSRRFEEVTQWERFVTNYFPDREIPQAKKARERLRKEVEPTLLTDPDFPSLAKQFQTKITLAGELIAHAIARQVPFQTVLMDRWFLSPELVRTLARLGKDWVSLLKKHRNVETASLTVRDANEQRIALKGPHITVEQVVELLPPTAYPPVTVGDTTYDCFTRRVRIPSLGCVRMVMCFDTAELTGTSAVLVTNRAEWSVQQILSRYLQRWPIETFYQDGTGHLEMISAHLRRTVKIRRKKHSIMELEGLGAEIWSGIDAQDYVNKELASWS